MHGAVRRTEQLPVQTRIIHIHPLKGDRHSREGFLLHLLTLQMGRAGEAGQHPAQHRNGHAHGHHAPRLAERVRAACDLAPGT
ncbi:hypothetical protein [Streptomyces malaysiensis]|uniref:hypothetical protein n=1 Tax=Streptomyces malaysiensis TaxID=92644 RepID=UPI002B2AF70E|nr:hypothetical protein R8789_20370 [Streptomyces malaysiensis]